VIGEDTPASEEELRQAERLSRVLDDASAAGHDVAPIDDALGAAWMIRASRSTELPDLRARAALESAWRTRRRAAVVRRAVVALAAAAALVAFVAGRPRRPAELPGPSPQLLRAQLAAARAASGPAFTRFQQEQAVHRDRVYAALRRAYGGRQ